MSHPANDIWHEAKEDREEEMTYADQVHQESAERAQRDGKAQ